MIKVFCDKCGKEITDNVNTVIEEAEAKNCCGNTMIYKPTNEIVEIFDISYNTCGYPTFLVYFNNQWVRKSAKYFRPIAED